MKDQGKTKKQLLNELLELRQRVYELEGLEKKDKEAEKILATAEQFDFAVIDRKQTEKALRENQLELLESQRVAKLGNWSWDIATDRISWSDELYRIFGIAKQDFGGTFQAFAERVHPDDLGLVLQMNQLSRTEGKPFDLEYRIVTPGGELKTIREIGYATRNEAGLVVRLFGTAQDITERKRAEKALQEERDTAQKYFDIAGVLLLVLDADQKVILINRKGCEILGYREEEIIGKQWSDHFLPERYRERLSASFAKLIAGDIEPVEYFENPVLTKSGKERMIAWHNTVMRDEAGNINRTLSSGEDITERNQAEAARNRLLKQLKAGGEQMRELSRRLAELQETERHGLARELHDKVGQNLTALSINLNIIRSLMRGALASKVNGRIDDSQKLVEETAVHIRDVMAELRPPVLDDFGLMATLNWYADRFSQRTGITMVVEGQELIPRLPIDKEATFFRIAQEALTNVVNHAQATRVTITFEATDEKVDLTISDNGIGFNSTGHPRPGTELSWGLITMRERAHSIGGQLRVEASPGNGTRIIVEVPRNN